MRTNRLILITVILLAALLLLAAGCTPKLLDTGKSAAAASGTDAAAGPAVSPLTVFVTPLNTSPLSTPGSSIANPAVMITYFATFTLQPGAGSLLNLDITIENRGYEFFNTSPDNFLAVVSNGNYSYDAGLSDLKTVDLPNGGKVTGKLVFPVPSGTASSRVGYRMVYSGSQAYKVWWVKSSYPTPDVYTTPDPQPAVVIVYSANFAGEHLIINMSINNRGYDVFNTSPEHFSAVVNNMPYPFDPERSDLKTVDVPDGSKINGMLTFRVPSGTASDRVGFEMQYSGTRLYNVQWFKKS